MHRRLDVWTRCDYQAQTAVSLSSPFVYFPVLSHLLSLSLSCSLHILTPPPSAFIQIICPSLSHCLCCVFLHPLFLAAAALVASPYISPFLPTLPPSPPSSFSSSFLEIFKADQHTLADSIIYSFPAWEKHVSYSGSGPDCMLWKWSGE